MASDATSATGMPAPSAARSRIALSPAVVTDTRSAEAPEAYSVAPSHAYGSRIRPSLGRT
ncbi:hypothetical protein Save01_09168 [Streptomyces avermitilis]